MSSSELENDDDWLVVEKDSNQRLAKIEPPRPQVPQGITRKELIVVHLTAKTVAYEGIHFEQELMSRVLSVNREFESLFRFLNPTDVMRGFYDEVTLVYVCASSLPPYSSEYTSGRVSTATVFEVFFNGVRLYLDLDHEEEGEKQLDFPYLLETDWSSKPIQWLDPTADPPWCCDMKFAVGGLDAYRDYEWYHLAVSKRKEYNDYMLLCKTEYNRQFPALEPIPMSLGLGESALVPRDQGLSLLSKMIQSTVQIWTNMWELGQTLINPPCERRLTS